MELEFSQLLFGKYSTFTKFLSLGAELFHADRLTDRGMYTDDEVNSPFSQFSERAKKPVLLPQKF